MRTVIAALMLSGVLAAQTQAPAQKTAPAVEPSYKALKYAPLREPKIPDIPSFTLSNGMKLYLLENHELPLISGFALVRTGNLFEPRDKIGLAQITGSVLRTGGTKLKTGDEIDVLLENMAASVESGIGETNGRVGFNCLKENTDQVLAVFKDVLLNPEFRQDKIDLAKTQARGGIARRNDDAHAIAGREFSDIVYGRDNPYGWSMEYETIDRIQRDDLIAFYKRYFFPANIILAVQGDFNTGEMRAKIEKLFADWDYKQPPAPPFPSVTAKPNAGVFLAVKNDVTQSFFDMGHLGGILRDKDTPALDVMSDILGGGFSSRLFKEVRTKSGLAYGISSNWGANYNHPGLFRVAGSTKSATTVDTIKAAQKQVALMRTEPVSAQELQTAKDTVLNAFVFNFDSPNKTLGRVITYEYYGYPKDFIFDYQKRVQAVTAPEILRVAKEYLKPDQMNIVVVGKPTDFKPPLDTLGPVKQIDLTIPQPQKPAAKSDAASLAKGRQLLARAQQAMGGTEKLAAVKDVTQISTVNIQTPQGAMQSKNSSMSIFPATFRRVQELPFGKVTVYYDGSSGWMLTPQGEMPMPAEVQRQSAMEALRSLVQLVLSDRIPNRTANAAGDNTVEISDAAGNSLRVEFDPSSGLPVRTLYQLGPAKVSDVLGGWKEVDGIKMPYTVVIERDGQKFADIKVEEYKLNTGLKPEDLSKKQ